MNGLEARVSLRREALELDVVIAAEAGTTTAILGPNGAGKTTLLRALAGLEPETLGTVLLDGAPLHDLPPERRPVGVVFQDYRLFPHLSARDNVAFGLRCQGATRAEAVHQAGSWLERMGLRDRAAARPAQLSGGEAQRVALARALATRPRLLLLDEPLSALDATTRAATRRELRRHLDGYDGVRVVVTHDPVEAATVASRMVVMEQGRVVQEGTTTDISAHPRSRYVADLVGVNLMVGRARAGRIELAGGAVLVAADAIDGDVLAVVHPRAVALHRQEPQGTARNVWSGTAGDVDYEGDRVRVQVGGPVPLVAEVTPAAVADLALNAGGPVWVSIKATEVIVYPA